jgi:hypothetical protein
MRRGCGFISGDAITNDLEQIPWLGNSVARIAGMGLQLKEL